MITDPPSRPPTGPSKNEQAERRVRQSQGEFTQGRLKELASKIEEVDALPDNLSLRELISLYEGVEFCPLDRMAIVTDGFSLHLPVFRT